MTWVRGVLVLGLSGGCGLVASSLLSPGVDGEGAGANEARLESSDLSALVDGVCDVVAAVGVWLCERFCDSFRRRVPLLAISENPDSCGKRASDTPEPRSACRHRRAPFQEDADLNGVCG